MKRPLLVLGALLLLAIATTWFRFRPVPRSQGPMPHQVYVWQRDWSPEVREAVGSLDADLSTPVLLAAQVSWQGTTPQVVRVAIDYDALAGKPFGLALRIGEIDPGQIDPKTIADLAKAVVAAAPTPPAELQIDFDCAESKLAGYRTWLVAIREAVRPMPVALTALPAWLDDGEFARLAAEGPYVLQVHSLRRPTDAGGDWRLIDPAAARAAIEKAARLRQSYRVALPTYGCAAVFDKQGQFVRLYAENFPGVDRRQYDVKWLRSDPAEMADLVRQWTVDRPAAMTGILWYRLPVAGDRLNWRMTTLKAVRQGITPAAGSSVRTVRNKGLLDLTLSNDGQVDLPLSGQIRLSWQGPPPIASDFVGGYRVLDRTPTSITLVRSDADPGDPANRLAPGEQRAIGWLRFEKDTEVLGHVTPP